MIRKYVVRVTNPDDGSRVFFNGFFGGSQPIFDPDEGSVMSFYLACKVASNLKRFYPLVHVCGIYDSSIVRTGLTSRFFRALLKVFPC